LKNKINEKDNLKNNNNSSVVKNVINNIFEDENCFVYDDLLVIICQQMNISNTDDEKVNQIKKMIDENCILIKEKYCFLKDEESDVKDVRNLVIKELGDNLNGMKKQQIKKIIEQNGLNISDSKLTKLLQKFAKYQGGVWSIKLPENV